MNGRMARREGCCNSGSGNSNCRQWMNQLRILDFTMTELILGCAPITAFDAGGDGTSWNWSMGPWPWESEAN